MSTKFPNTIYKERNFEIKLQLCDCEGNPVQNGKSLSYFRQFNQYMSCCMYFRRIMDSLK